MLRADDPDLYRPDKVNPNFPTDTEDGDVDAASAAAAVLVDETYRTPAQHNNPMEPHATTAQWDGDELTVYDSNQGAAPVQQALAGLFGYRPAPCTWCHRTSVVASGRRAHPDRSSWRRRWRRGSSTGR